MANIPLDDRDVRMLSILSREGRISKTELARRVNLSATPCWERLKRLEDAGLIRGYHADVSLDRLGPSIVVFVLLELENHRAETFQTFERAVGAHDEILACWSIGGGFDYLMQVVTRDVDSYQRLIDALLERRLGLKRYYTHIMTKEVKASGALPLEALLSEAPET